MKKLLSTMLTVAIMLSALGCSSTNNELETPQETNYGNEVNQTENETIEPIIIPSPEDEKPDIDPQPIQSTEDFDITSDNSGNLVLTAYKGNGGDVVIPDGVTEIAPHVFDLIMNPNGITITSVYIPDSVKIIGDYAFLSCHSLDGGLASVRMSSNIEKIGESAFDNCIYLTDVTFDEIPAHNIKIGDKAFAYCEKLEHCDLYGLSCTLGKDVYIGTSLVKNKTLEKIIEDNKAAITEEIYSIIREAEKVRYDIREPELEIVSITEDRADCIFWSDWEWSRKAEEDPMILGMNEAMEALSDAQEIEYANDIIQGWIPEIESWYITDRIEQRIVIKQNNGSWTLHYPHVENGEETLFDLAEYAAEHWTEDSEARKQGGADIINDAIKLYREMEKPYGNWTQYTETHTVSGQEFTVSFTCPEKWQIESSGILNDENGKRIGERVFREDFSFEEFKQESSRSDGHSVLINPDSPYQGSTQHGMAYIGYHKRVESSIDYSGADVYTFLIQYSDSMFMHISVWQQDTDEYDDFLNSVVLPIVNSVTIEEPEHENTSPSNTLSQNNESDGIVESPVSGSTPETVYKDSFCLIPGYLSDYIGNDEYKAWQENVLNTSRSNKHDPYQYINIYEFIKQFDISRNEFEEIYYTSNLYYLYNYNFDILYGDSADDVYEYYNINTPDNIDVQKRGTELSIKKAIKNYVGKERFNEWLKEDKLLETTYFNDVWWGISEAVYKFDISRDVLAEIISECTGVSNDIVEVEVVYENGSTVSLVDNVIPSYTYNLDLIYVVDTENNLLNTDSETIIGYKLDEMLRTQFPITDEEIVEIIDNLLLYEIYGVYGSLLTSNEKDDSGMYYKVTDENFDEYSEWIDFLENLFCDKYLEMVYNETSESIVNINGYTYDDGSASGSTLSKDYTYKLFENDDHQIILTIIRDDFSYGHEGIDEKSVVLRETETGWKISDSYFLK